MRARPATDTYTPIERNCATVTDTREKVTGYDVSYRLGGQEGTVRMDHHPRPPHSGTERPAGT
jgi:uncharacterized protein YcfJ